MNGKHSESDVSFVVGEPLVITAVNDELQLFNPAIGNVHNNTNYPARYFKGELAEIIAYNRKLSAAERKEVELHLKKKWISGVEEVSIAQEDMLVTAAEQNVGIDVVAFSEWGLVSDQSWAIPSVANGTSTTNVSLRVAANIGSLDSLYYFLVSCFMFDILHPHIADPVSLILMILACACVFNLIYAHIKNTYLI